MGMFGLSATGYDRLGLAGATPADIHLGTAAFQRGMRRGGRGAGDPYFWDPDIASWEDNYREGLDAFLLLAHDDDIRLADFAGRARAELSNIGIIVAEEHGRRLRPSANGAWDIEHYGFREGVAKVRHHDRVLTLERSTGKSQDGKNGQGCFAAFLKLEQNVLRFIRASQELAGRVNRENGWRIGSQGVRELAVGRRVDGEPLAPKRNNDKDDFTFQGVSPDVCPYHAHIRVMNPRNGNEPPAFLRRGLAYGPERTDLNEPVTRQLPPSAGSGLLFLSFQQSLLDFLDLMIRAQKALDPMLARSSQAAGNRGQEQSWIIGGREVRYPMSNLTTIRGGEYFYIPSMQFIDRLDRAPD
jgi:deferrochelatase/peroxidase EfeB